MAQGIDHGRDEPGERLHALSHRWADASERAFAAGPANPAVYAGTIRLVRAVVDTLREDEASAAALLAAWDARSELVASVTAADDLVTTDGLEVELVVAAAFAMRHHEVLAETTRARRRETLADHGAVGWAILEESGPHQGDPFVPYRRLEVDAGTGRAILATTHPDDTFTATIHRVEQLSFDRSSGQLTSAPTSQTWGEADTAPTEFPDAEAREQHIRGLRARG